MVEKHFETNIISDYNPQTAWKT